MSNLLLPSLKTEHILSIDEAHILHFFSKNVMMSDNIILKVGQINISTSQNRGSRHLGIYNTFPGL